MIEILQQAIATFGPDMQQAVAIEEMAELTKELCKYKRGQDNFNHIAEEIADVEIMLEQLILIHNIGPLVEAQKQKKLKRLKERLEYSQDSKASDFIRKRFMKTN